MPLSLRANLPVDDTDSHFAYSAGDWQEQTGSTRQFNGNVHVTNTFGATVSFRYSGQAFILYGTTPVGGGNVVVDISIDGGSASTISIPCDSTQEQFSVDFFESPVVEFGVHTVVVTNKGRSSDPSFMFDNVILYSNDINPTMASPPTLAPSTTSSTSQKTTFTPASTSSNPSPTQTPQTDVKSSSTTTDTTIPTNTQSRNSAQDPTQSSTGSPGSSTAVLVTTLSTSESTSTFLSTDSRGSTFLFTQTQTFTTALVVQTDSGISALAVSKPSHIGTILAGVFGGLAFLLLLAIAFIFCRRRNSRRKARLAVHEDESGLVLKKTRTGRALTMPQPFVLDGNPNATSPGPDDESPTSGSGSGSGGQPLPMSEKAGYLAYASRFQKRGQSSEPDSSSGPSSSNPLEPHPRSPSDSSLLNTGFSTAAQPDAAAHTLSHRHSVSMSDRDAVPRPTSPTMSSMYMSSTAETYDAPPAYQPPASGQRVSDFKTPSQLDNDHTSHPPEGG